MIPDDSVFPAECDGVLCDHCVPYGCSPKAGVFTLPPIESNTGDSVALQDVELNVKLGAKA